MKALKEGVTVTLRLSHNTRLTTGTIKSISKSQGELNYVVITPTSNEVLCAQDKYGIMIAKEA